MRRFDEAQTVLDRVLEISPGNESVLAAKAGIFQGQGRLKEAAEVLAKIPANSQDEAVSIQRAIQLYDERQFDAAIVYIQHNMPPPVANDPRTITLLGLCQKLAGKTNEARDTFARAVTAMKPTPDAVAPVDARQLPCYLAWAYAGLGEKDKALEQARQAIADYAIGCFIQTFRRSHSGYYPGTIWRYRFRHRRFAASSRSAEWRNSRRPADKSELGPVAQRSAFPKTLRRKTELKPTARELK